MGDPATSELFSNVLTELQDLVSCVTGSSSNEPSPLPDSLLSDLHSLLSAYSGPSNLISHLDIPLAGLLRHLASSIDSGQLQSSLQASFAYLSLLLTPSAPVVSLFSPLHFLSLLRSLRRSIKNPGNFNSSPGKAGPKGRGKSKVKPNSKTKQNYERNDAVDLIPKILGFILNLLSRIQLDSYNDIRKGLMDTITEVLDSSHYHTSSNLCFEILNVIVSEPRHGDRGESTVETFRSLTPLMLLPIKSPVRLGVVRFVVNKIVPLGNFDEGVKKAVVSVPRCLAIKAPEKAEYRACAVDTILEITRVFTQDDLVEFVNFVLKLSKGKPKLRLLSVDLIIGLLNLPSNSETDTSWRSICLEALMKRCSDTIAGIRGKALSHAAHVFGEMSERKNEIEMEGFSEMVKRRCVDDKAVVRKAALVLVSKAMGLIGTPVDESLLSVLGSACSDPLVSIRKAALSAISEVFRRFPDSNVTREWLQAVPALIADNETSIQEECENLFLELVFNRISQPVKDPYPNPLFPSLLSDLLKGVSEGEVAPFVKKICSGLGKTKKIRPLIVSSLERIISASGSVPEGAWWLLGEVSFYIPKAVDWKFLSHHWKLLDDVGRRKKEEREGDGDDVGRREKEGSEGDDCGRREKEEGEGDDIERREKKERESGDSVLWARDRVALLQTISNVSMELPADPASDLAFSLLTRIEGFNMHLSEVNAHVKSLKTLCKRKAKSSEEGQSLVLKWSKNLISKAVDALSFYLSDASELQKNKEASGQKEKEKKKDALEASIQKEKEKKKDTLEASSRKEKDKSKEALEVSSHLLKAVTAVFTVGSVVIACPAVGLQGIIPLLHTIITSGNNNAKKPNGLVAMNVSFKEVAPDLYVQSWTTMGKICLVDDKLAKSYIPLFVQELDKSNLPELRNNIMVAMADFCVRYTALVDGYIPRITRSLGDPCEVVRRHTFVLLSRLLQRDYVKWRGVLFLRFLLSLVDDSEKIRHLADFLFSNILKVKAPLLAYNSFIEAIYVLNGHQQGHSSSDRANDLFAIKGMDESSKTKRMHIYVSLLKQMAPEHLLATSAKLCAEILAATCDGLLNIDNATAQAVLQDTLQILACKEMRIQTTSSSESTEMDEEPVTDNPHSATSAAAQAIKGRVITQVAKKNLIQIAIPIFIELKRLLESCNSPLTGSLMDCLRSLLKDYKNEIDEILVADKQLQKELLYDMNKHEEEANKAKDVAGPSNVDNGSVIKKLLKDQRTQRRTPSVSKSLAKVKGSVTSQSGGSKPADVLESLRRKPIFESDNEED